MNKIILSLLAIAAMLQVQAAKYFLAPSGGSNSNPGTISQPFATLPFAVSALSASDTLYLRGGTYRTAGNNGTGTHFTIQNLNGSASDTFKIFAYPGEFPVFNLDNITPSNANPTAFAFINSDHVHIRGIRITGMKQHTGGSGISRGFHLENVQNCKLELIEVDNIGGYGIYLRDGVNDNWFLNCDAHHIDDRHTAFPDAWKNANGLDCTGGVNATRNTFEGMRIWWCSDDGFDFYGTNGVQTLKNCWAFWNGFEPGTFTVRGDGDGFKIGPDAGGMHSTLLRTITRCFSFENNKHGFDQNNGDMKYKLYNNTSFGNGGTGYMFDYISPAPVQDFKNNLSFMDGQERRGDETDGTTNSWEAPVTITADDFKSLSSAGANGPRKADGSLPDLPFMKLVTGSDLVNAATNIPGETHLGTGTDIGAFEYVPPGVLSLYLRRFIVKVENNKAVLDWETANEVNVSHFEVERNTSRIGRKAAGFVNYQYIDSFPIYGINYYRLKMVDNDSSFAYSKTVATDFKGRLKVKTANAKELVISSPVKQNISLSVFNILGQLLIVSTLALYKGDNHFYNPIPATPGIKYIKIAADNEVVVAKIVD